MQTLTEFLKVYQDKERAREAQTGEQRRQWIASVSRLMEQLKSWIREADPENTLEVQETPVRIREEALGQYQVPSLVVALDGDEVRIVPRGYRALGYIPNDPVSESRIQGRVDLTNGIITYYLYRIVDSTGERWVLVWYGEDRASPLNRSSLETALVGLLG